MKLIPFIKLQAFSNHHTFSNKQFLGIRNLLSERTNHQPIQSQMTPPNPVPMLFPKTTASTFIFNSQCQGSSQLSLVNGHWWTRHSNIVFAFLNLKSRWLAVSTIFLYWGSTFPWITAFLYLQTSEQIMQNISLSLSLSWDQSFLTKSTTLPPAALCNKPSKKACFHTFTYTATFK